MKKMFDFLLLMVMFFGIASISGIESVTNHLVVINTTDTIYVEKVEVIKKKNTFLPKTIHTKQEKEWYAFEGSKFSYNYTPLEYSEGELIHFANILFKEAGSSKNTGKEIDMYFVAIAGVQRILCENDKWKTVTDMLNKSNSFQYPKIGQKPLFDSILSPMNYKAWLHCKQVCKNVLDNTIPKHVPYIPYGTFCYWNSRLDTNMAQKRYLERYFVCIASTVQDHHYYVHKSFANEEELEYLKKIQAFNPVAKNITNGTL